jgi:hypothetical protein
MSDEFESFEDAEILHITDNGGVKVKLDSGEHWLPQKAIHENSEVYQKGDTGKLVVCQWFLNKNPEWGE